jgi:hypothetical protein
MMRGLPTLRTAEALLVTLAAFAFTAPALAQSAVSLPTTLRAGVDADAVVPITVSPADGVTAMDFVFTYDPAVLRPTGAYRTGYTNAFAITRDFSVPGTVRVSLSGGAALSGGGRVAWVTFKTIGAVGTFSDFVWVSATLNGGAIATTTTNGKLTLISATADCSVPDTAQGPPGTPYTVPIVVAPTNGATAFDITLYFNPNVIAAQQVNTTPLTAGWTLTTNLNPPGEVRISLFSTAATSGSGSVADVVMNIVGPVGDRTPLDLIRCDINGRAISSKLDDGHFRVCSVTDDDGDGVTDCAGDCNDADPEVKPGATERCNAVDDDCDGANDEGFNVGAWCTTGLGICERSGSVVCAAGGLASECDAVPGPPSVETCNGLDDDCDGSADNNVTAPGAVTDLVIDAPAHLAWTAVAGAEGYDVQRGSLVALLAAGGDFAASLAVCAANDLLTNEATDTALPGQGGALWYLARASNCGGTGTFDEAGAVASRDAGIAASGEACP